MKELKVKENNTELKIEINGEPKYTNLSELNKSMLASKYEKVVFEIFEKYLKRKKWCVKLWIYLILKIDKVNKILYNKYEQMFAKQYKECKTCIFFQT